MFILYRVYILVSQKKGFWFKVNFCKQIVVSLFSPYIHIINLVLKNFSTNLLSFYYTNAVLLLATLLTAYSVVDSE